MNGELLGNAYIAMIAKIVKYKRGSQEFYWGRGFGYYDYTEHFHA